MYSKANKVLSLAMSAAILLTNMMTPMNVYADEVNDPAQDLESEMPPETEPVSYYLTLPYNEAVSYSVDESHVERNEDPKEKAIRLAYHEEDKVEFAFQTMDTVQVMEIHLKDREKQEYPFSIDENRKITVFMPAKDLELTLVMEEIPVPEPVPETEQPAEPAPAAEAEQPVDPAPAAEPEFTWNEPTGPDEGINEFDLTAQEVTGDQSSYIPEDLVPEDNQEDDPSGETEGNIPDGTDMEDVSTQPNPENGNEDAGAEAGEIPADAAVETSEVPEDGSGETAGEAGSPGTPGIALTAETEEDGLPTQGSILTVETLTIPLMDVDFTPETDFSNISFSPETDQIELVSDEVDITNPGTYSTIYRVTHNGGEKMWYVLRPVVVLETTGARESETVSGSEDGSGESGEEAGTESGEDDSTETESETPAEVLPESVSEAGEEVVTEAQTEEADLADEEAPTEEVQEEVTEAAVDQAGEETLTEDVLEAVTEAAEENVTESAEPESEEATDPEAATEALEDLTEEETESETTQGEFKINITKGEELGIVLDHEDGTYDAGETVTFSTDLSAGTLTAVGALKSESNKKIDTEDILYSEVSYNSGTDTFTFEMPAEDIDLEVSEDFELGTVLLAAASDDDWDDNTDVEAGSYYYFSDGTLHPFNSVMGSGGNDSYKYVRYKVDGKTYTVYAYCMQHSMTSPPSGTTYTSMIELDEGGDDKYLRKAMFYGYGGPGWGDTFNGYNIKTIMTNYGCSSEMRAMQHYLVDYLYDGESGFGGNLSQTAKNMLAEIKAALAKMPDPTATELKPGLSTKATSNVTETFTWKANEAFTITIHLEDGVKLVNETTGKSGTGNVKVKGGEKFHLEATGDMSKLKGNYEITSNYPLDFHAMLLKLASSQDIGFGYYTDSKGLELSVEWPDEGYVTVKKVAADGKSYDLSGMHIGLYSDSGATKKLHEFVTKTDGSSDTYKVTPGTYYVKEISVPEGWDLNSAIQSVKVTASNSTAAKAAVVSVSNPRTTKVIEVQKKDAVTGQTRPMNASYSFTGMKVTIYADAALTSVIETLTTDANGYAKSSPLQYGTYYLRETAAPKGYDIYDHTFTVVLANTVKIDGKNADKAYLLFEDQPRKKPVEVQKQDADTGKTEPFNGRYSFDKTEVTIYSDAACTSTVTKVTTDQKGYGKSTDLYYGTYYARETKAPSGYDLYDHTFKVVIDDTVTVDGAATAKIIVKDPARKKPMEVQKVDKDTGKTEPFNKNYSFDKMEVTIYRDEALTEVEQVLTSDAKGYAKSKDLYYGTYYVRETKPPKGYQLYDHTFIVDIGNDLTVDGKKVNSVKLLFTDEIIRKPVAVQKYDKEKGTTTPNNKAVTFKGAQYTIYEDAEMTKVLEVLTTDESGKAESKPYPYETYYVKETATPVGYLMDEIVYKVVIDDVVTVNGAAMDVIENKKAVVSSYEQVIRGAVSVMKYLDDSVDTSIMQEWIDKEMLKGIEFTLTHEDESVEPVKIVTDRFGHAQTKTDELVYGNWSISETAGTPEGYQGLDQASIMVSENGVTLHYVITNKKPQLQIVLYKKDALTGELIPIKGAKFQIKDKDGNVLSMPDNLDYSKVTDTFTTNEEGIIAFTVRFEPGKYTVTEVEAPEGFLLAPEQTVTLKVDDDVTVPFLCEVMDMPQRGQIRVTKKDTDTDETLKEGFTFDVFTAEDIKDASGKIRTEEIDGETVTLKAGTKVDTIMTGEDGTAITRELLLGSYKVVETGSAEYYAVDDTQQEVTLAYDKQVETVRYELTVKDEKTKFDLFKVDSDTDQPLAGITFRIFSTADKEAEKARQVAEAVEQLRAEQELAKQDLFEKQQLALANLGDVTEERRAEFIANQEEELAAFEAGLAKERQALEEKLMAELEITDISGLGTDFITDANGQIHVEELLHENTYYIYEIATLPGYNLDTTIHEFTVDSKGLIAGQKRYTVKLTNQPNVVEISKKEITGEKELPGATLTLSDSEGKVIETWISTEEPHVIKGLPAGIYTLKEEIAPEGYALAEDITFELTDSLTVQQVTMYDEQLQIHFSKKEITGEKELPGASLKVTDLEGTVIDEWISTEEEHVINLKVGKYVMTEVAPPEKYATAESIEFEVKADLSVQKVEMKDAPIQVEISKKDITNGEELPGAYLQVLDVDGKVVEEWDSTTEPHMISLAVGTYTLVETIAPNGFATASVISFEVKDTAEIQKVEMFDDITKVEISKTDITTGEELPGARLTVKDSEGKVVEEWVSTAEPHYFEKLPVGTYTLTETTSPEGYGTAETITFEVKNTTQLQKVEMKDAPLRKVEISKTDITTSKELPGAHVSVTDESGKVIDEWISTDKPHMMTLDAGKYILKEEKAPDGYVTAEEVAFEVVLAKDKDDIEVMKVEMKDDVTKVEISKQDITNEKELPGAKLIIKDEKGKEVESWTSTKEPHMIEKLPVGKYTLTEVTAPKGYDIAETVSFEVTDSAEIVHVKMMDKPKDELVDLTGKKKETTTGGQTVTTPGSPGIVSVIAQSVKTGDYNRYLPAILLVVCGIAGLAGVFVGRKRKKLTEK